MQETIEKRAPFNRFHLEHTPITLPTSMQNIHVDTWNDFWECFKPILKEVRRVDRWTTACSLLGFVLIAVGTFVIVIHSMHYYNSSAVINILIATGCGVGVCAALYLRMVAVGYVTLSNLEKYQSFCNKYEPTFASFGYSLECRLESAGLTDGRPGGYYLYFFPVNDLTKYQDDAALHTSADNNIEMLYQHGYLRFEIAHERATCGTQKSTASPGDYLPAGMESATLMDWNFFWSNVDKNSSSFVNCYFKRMFWYEWEVARIEKDLHAVIDEYSGRFWQQGIYMEFCKVTTFHKFVGGYPRWYLYFFPKEAYSNATDP